MGILSPPHLSFRARGVGRQDALSASEGAPGGEESQHPANKHLASARSRQLAVCWFATFAGLPTLAGLLSLQVSPFRLSFRAPRTGPQTALNASKGPVGWRGSPSLQFPVPGFAGLRASRVWRSTRQRGNTSGTEPIK